MIIGAHAILYSQDAEKDRRFLGASLGLKSVDVGGGWLIFALPPAEIAVHPTESAAKHELYLMCDDVEALISEMRAHDIECSGIQDQSWGRLTELTLPGGGKLGVYEPRHPSPMPRAGAASRRGESHGPKKRGAGVSVATKANRRKAAKKTAARNAKRSAVARKKRKPGTAGRRT